MIKNLNADHFWLLAFYSMAHGSILILGNSIYWDDWILLGAPNSDILNLFHQTGSFFNYAGWVHVAFSYAGGWSYKVATFVLIYLTGIYFYKIVYRDFNVGRNVSFWLALIFLTTPLYIARIASIDFIYTLSVFLFVLGWWYLTISRPLAVIFFALSFNTQSLLVFYTLPIAFLYFRSYRQKSLFQFVLRHLDLILLPFLWFILKQLYFKPYGAYSGYNSSFAITNILPSIEAQWADLINFVQNFIFTKIKIETRLVVFVLALINGLFFLRSYFYKISANKCSYLFFIGLAALVLGLFPYWVLGHIPTFWDWSSRHQLLMPFGVSCIIVSIANILKPWQQKLFLVSFVSIFVSINLSNYEDLYFDWQKQKLIINVISKSELAKNSNLLIFNDETNNALYRSYRFYEWSGLVNQAFPGDHTRFGINLGEIEGYENGHFDNQFDRFFATRSHVRNDELQTALITITRDGAQIVVNIKRL